MLFYVFWDGQMNDTHFTITVFIVLLRIASGLAMLTNGFRCLHAGLSDCWSRRQSDAFFATRTRFAGIDSLDLLPALLLEAAPTNWQLSCGARF